jgi:uncharacterized protein
MLRSVVLSLSDLCNINCAYCFENKAATRLQNHPEFDNLLHQIAQAAIVNEHPPLEVSFYGGEPLTQFRAIKHVVDTLIERVGKPLITFSVATNGILLRGEIAQFLIDADFGIQLSIDGVPRTHDALRKDFRGRGTFSAIEEVVADVQRFPRMKARMTVTPSSAALLDESLGFLLSVGFNDSAHPIRFDFDLTSEWSESSLTDLDRAVVRAISVLLAHYRQGGHAVVEPLDRVYANQRNVASCGQSQFCGAGVVQQHVTPQGDVYPCNRLTPAHAAEHATLKLDHMKLVDLVPINMLEHIHPTTVSKPECSQCSARRFCGQTCPARRHSSSGSFQFVSETQCRTTRATFALGRQVKVHAVSEGWPERLGVHCV